MTTLYNLLWLNDSRADGIMNQFGKGWQIQLMHNVRAMSFNGFNADIQC